MRISENRRSLELAILLTPIGPFRRISMGVGFLGIELEGKQNAANASVISKAAARVAVRVIHTDEEWMIANTVCRVLGLGTPEKVNHENKAIRGAYTGKEGH